jgi:hypothetical protein
LPSDRTPEERTVSTPTEARGGRIVRGGAIRRILLVSIAFAVIALLLAFFLV